MVTMEHQQGGLPEFGTVLTNPDFAAVARAIGLHGVRVETPGDLDDAVRDAPVHPGPVLLDEQGRHHRAAAGLLDVLINPDEISVPGKVEPDQAWGFAIAKFRETVLSQGDS